MTEDDLYDLRNRFALADGRVYPYVVSLGGGSADVPAPYIIFLDTD